MEIPDYHKLRTDNVALSGYLIDVMATPAWDYDKHDGFMDGPAWVGAWISKNIDLQRRAIMEEPERNRDRTSARD
jgi:hypothetical protein